MAITDWTAVIADWADDAWRAASEIVEYCLAALAAVLSAAVLFAALAMAGLMAGQISLLLIFLALISCSC